MKEENYIVIQGFMRTKLNLKGSELLAYALIYGFTQDGETWFTGSMSYIAEWLGVTRQNAMACMKRLVDNGLIERQERTINGVKFIDYRIVANNTGCTETIQGGCTETTHHNIGNDKIVKKEIVSKDTSKNDDVVEIENAIVRYTGNEKLRSILREFVEYRRKKRSKMSIKAFGMMLNKLRGFTEEEQIDAIETAIISNWTGVFPKHKTKPTELKPVSSYDEEQQRYEARRKAEADARWAEIERQTALRTEQFRREERGEV